MRTTLMRVAVLGASLALTSVATPARATHGAPYSSDSCHEETARKLVTNQTAGAFTKVWVEEPTSYSRIVCFTLGLGIGGGAIVIDATPGGSLPHAQPGDDEDACPVYAVNNADPVLFRLGVDTATSTICLVVEDKVLTLAFSPGSPEAGIPQIEGWRDGRETFFDAATCPVDYALSFVGTPTNCLKTNGKFLG